MIAFPNPKINIGLYVTKKRTDGFHEIETIFYPVDYKKDKLKIELSKDGSTTMVIDPSSLVIERDDNLCYKAYSLLKKEFFLPEVKISLTKEIPLGAGLGGGSSDAAFTLMLLNKMFNLNISKPDLIKYAEKLGSDVPFFIENSPVFATGKGEIMEPISLDLSNKEIMIVKPDISISTKEAYSGITPKPPPFNLRDINLLPLSDWRYVIRNDFEETVFQKYPQLKEIKDNLYIQGADYVSMTGSGSAIYAIRELYQK